MSIKPAEKFLLSSLKNGLTHSYDVEKKCWVKPYPEATGYLIRYFSEYYDEIPSEILSAAQYLCKIQHKRGGYFSFINERHLFTFDTAQIMHGLLSLFKKTNDMKFLEVAKKCAKFILGMQINSGAMFPIYDLKFKANYVKKKGGWGTNFSYIQVKNIEGLLLLYEITYDSQYKKAAEKLKIFGKRNCDLTFTHPGAYCLEGLFAIGEKDFVYSKLKEEIVPLIQEDGFLPYSKGLSYAYVSGSVQMGILLYKAGLKEFAYSILKWARKVQSNHNSGGLFQYANQDGSLNQDIHSEINTWGTKYYAELERYFEENGSI
jgi:hypothetical protein